MRLLIAALLVLSTGAFAREERGAAPGDFDFYVLALSWSPGFCELEGDRKEREQCEPGSGLGFVLHGLWPQRTRGYPTECGAARAPTRIALDEARGVYPSEGLARHQWRKHGTCSGLDPAAYFRLAARMRDRVAIPESFRRAAGDQRLTPIAIERAFADVNPGLRPDMMGVACRRGVLQEVRICLDKADGSFVTCPEVDRAGCRGGEIAVRAMR